MADNCPQEQSFCPVISFSKITLEEGAVDQSLIVTTEAFIKEIDYGDLLSGWLNDDLLGEHLKIKIIQSTHSLGTDKLKTLSSQSGENYAGISNYDVSGENVLSVQEYSITDILQGKIESQYTTTDSDGNIVSLIPFTFQFQIDNTSNPEHLSYFVFSYYDFADLGFNLPTAFEQVTGQVEYRTVIDKFSIQGQSDSVVQDFRSVERLNDLEFQPDLMQSNFATRVHQTNLLTRDNLDIIRNSAYFSNFYVTRDNDGNARFFFGLDFRKLMLENLVFGSYFVNATDSVIDDIISRTKINLLKIVRKRVKPLNGTNKLGGTSTDEQIFDKNVPETIIVSTNELNGEINAQSGMGTIREVSVISDPNLKNIRHFTGSDLTAASQTFGHFQYGVEIEIEDGTVDYIIEKYDELLEVRSPVDAYINLLNIPRVYDLSEDQLDIDSEWEKDIFPAIERYFGILIELFTENSKDTEDMLELLTQVLALTHPSTRDSRGILTFQKLVSNLLNKMESTINVVSNRVVRSSSEYISSGGQPKAASGTSRRTHRIQKYFAELFDSETPKNIGADYLSTDKPETSVLDGGLKTIEFDKFVERLDLEMLKYYSSTDTDIAVNIVDEVYSLNTNINTTPIFFSPAIMNVGNTQHFTINQGTNLINEDLNNSLAAEIMSFKRTGDLYNSLFVSKDGSSLPGSTEKTKYYLMNTFGAFNLTLVPEPPPCDDRDSFVILDDALEVATWTTDQQTETKQDTETALPINLNPVPFLLGLASGFTVNTALSTEQNLIPTPSDRVDQEGSFSIDILNPGSTNNIFGNNLASEFSNSEILSGLPPQLTSIVASYTAPTTNVRYDWSEIPIEPSTVTSFVFNYLLLQGVEFLVGYDITFENDKILIKHPLWETASLEKLIAYGSSEVFCRLKRYESEIIPSVEEGAGLDLPPYNSYFIVKNVPAMLV